MKFELPTTIQAIIFDFDGVFTDNRVIVDEDGNESVICNRSDGLGISAIKKCGFTLLVLSKEKNPVVQKRCEKMGIPYVQGVDDKKTFLVSWLEEKAINRNNVIYLGNDVNDIECLQYVGCGVVVADAHEDVKKVTENILKNKGGQGAVRELCDQVISSWKGSQMMIKIQNNNMSSIPVFITARMGSTRFQGKHLQEISGKPIIEQMIVRIKHAKLPRFIALCTTTFPEDNVFEEIANRCDIKIFRGHPTDILKRWLDAADNFDVQYFISAEADDVFCDPVHIDKVIQVLKEDKYDYISCKGLPFGVTPTGIKVDALRKICSLKEENDTEGQERFFTKTGLFRVHYIEIDDPGLINPDARMTLDYPEDYEFFKTIYSHLYKQGDFFSLSEILSLLKKNPEIIEINKKMQEKYQQRFKEKYGPVYLKRM
jgi:spore coat polysaccharide biosynthesis protein SpsF